VSLQRKRFDRRKVLDRFFGAFCSLAIAFAGILLASLLWTVWEQGAPRLGLKSPPPGQLTGKLRLAAPDELQPSLKVLAQSFGQLEPKVQITFSASTGEAAARGLVYGSHDVLLAPTLDSGQQATLARNRFELLELPFARTPGSQIALYASAKSLAQRELEAFLRHALGERERLIGATAGLEPLDQASNAAAVSRLESRIEGGFQKLVRFLTSFTSATFGEQAGIKAALWGTLWVIGLTALISIPIGIGAAIFLEEFTLRKTRFTEFIQLNIANLAGVPSIVYGLLGLALFVRWFSLDRSVISGALTMSLLILPMIIIVSQEALRAVPRSYRDGSYAMGATHWQTIRRQVLPNALPGILTGIILSVSRAMGETAPIITIGAVTTLFVVPKSIHDNFTALPIQIYNWTDRPQPGFREAAAAGILVLLAVLILLNSIAIYLRYRYRGKA